MAISTVPMLYVVVLVAGLLTLPVSTQVPAPEPTPDLTPLQDFQNWVSHHKAKYSAYQVSGNEDLVTNETSSATSTCVRTVGKAGSGAQYTTVKDAIASIPDGNSQRCVIIFDAGEYFEKIVVPAKKPFITFQGAGADKTFLKWDDTAESAGSTAKSSSTTVLSDFYIAQDIAFVNTAPAPAGGAVGQQAVAFRIDGDKAQFYRVAFYGAQDTLYDKLGMHYYKDCYIQGSIDFIFGDGQSYFETCHLNSIANPGSGSLTAQKRIKSSEASGFSFVNCLVTGNGPIYLGRAWGAYSRVVFLMTEIDAPIIPAGWFDWGVAARQKTVYYGQWRCTGVGADTTGRVSWSHDLTDLEAAPFLSLSFIDGNSWIGKV